ncbi:MAG: hypothetical protein ABR522_07160 [Marinobacter sp.]
MLTGDSAWLETLPKGSTQLWVLPALERCFLRHTNGLDLLRGLMERAFSGEWGPGIIGCDSQALGLLAHDSERWQVTSLAYATVREFLRVRTYLTDGF